MNSKREVWVDYLKVFACVLVVLGHFFQSMVKARVIPESHAYQWFNTTLYYFHVPLFFICSGYLYQRYAAVRSWESWKNNAVKKLVALGVPYFIFSFITWLLKTVFSGAVNEQVGGLLDTLFLHPVSPYWYLYILFLFFLITPTAKSLTGLALLLGVSLALKAAGILMAGSPPFRIYAVAKICQHWVWFVSGMLLALIRGKKLRKPAVGLLLGAAFIGLSIVTYQTENGFIAFAMGALACCSAVLIAYACKERKALSFFSQYTMPVFLMHTLFAALTRIVLVKLNVSAPAIHLAAGLVMSFASPILAAAVMKRLKIDWILSPKIRLKSKAG